jgi:putative glycosyltransferase (TIGR04372 family)
MRSALRYLSGLDLNVIKIGTEKTSISSKNQSENYFDLCDWNLSREEFELICLYVWSKSIFFIGNLSGGTMPPNTFGTPTFWFDVFPLAHVRLPGLYDYFIPKKVYSYRLQRNLTFSEMFTYQDSQSENPLRLSESGYRLIDVSELDIFNGVKSMVDVYLYKDKIVDNDCKIIEYENVYRKNGFPYGAKIDLHFLSDYII